MKPAIRTQVDELGDAYSEATALTFDPKKDKTRQEFKNDTDPNVILARMGIHGAPLRRVSHGEVNTEMDLQQAIHATKEAQAAHRKLPPELRRQYPSLVDLFAAIELGKITAITKQESKPDDSEAKD